MRTGDRVAVRTGRGIAEQLYELLLDVGRDRVLPPRSFRVHLFPLEPDDVDEQSFGEPVPPHDGGREPAALFGEVEATVTRQLDVPLVLEPGDGLGHGGGRQPEALDETGAERNDAFLLDREDRLEVLLGGVVHLRHALQVTVIGTCVHGLALAKRECQTRLALW